MYMVRLTTELSGPQVRRTGDVGMAANGASASLLTGCSRQRLEAHADDARASSGRNRRRHCIRHARNRAGRPAVCRRSLRNGAFRHHLCILPLNAWCQLTLWCAVSLLLCRRRRLPRRLTRLRSCRQRWPRRERRVVRARVRCLCLLAFAVAFKRVWRRQAFGGPFWYVSCCCMHAGGVLGVRFC